LARPAANALLLIGFSELALHDGDLYCVAVMQSEHDGLVLGACVCTVLSHLAATAGPLPLARRAVGCVRTVLTVA
jgi:hypothetical protein